MMEKTTEVLADVPLFEGLPQDQLRRLAAISLPRQMEKGAFIFSEDEVADGFYVVVSGAVKIYKMSPEGKEKILHIFGPPEPFGEVPVFAGKRFPAYAQALSAGQLLFFPRTAFVRLLAEMPSLSLNMLAVLSARLRQFTVQIESLSLKEVPGRLAAYLLSLAQEQGREGTVALTMPKGQLAGILGTIPETLSRIFARMSQQGLIQVSGRRIALLDRGGLSTIAETGKFTE